MTTNGNPRIVTHDEMRGYANRFYQLRNEFDSEIYSYDRYISNRVFYFGKIYCAGVLYILFILLMFQKPLIQFATGTFIKN